LLRRRPRSLAAPVAVAAALAVGAAPVARADGPQAECPHALACRFVPAAYAANDPAHPEDYGNYDLADRPQDDLGIRFIVVHDTEVEHDGAIALFQDPRAKVSAHYLVRSADGQVTQLVRLRDVAWHAGNWWMNTHAIGIENEGFALDPRRWFTDAMYRSLARLIRWLARRYDVPLDRAHIIGHDQVPGPTAAQQPAMHWDPGPFFDWDRLMELVGARDDERRGDARIVTIRPDFARNRPGLTTCEPPPCRPLPDQGANVVFLHTAPTDDSPLIGDPTLAGTPLEPDGAGTTQADDWGPTAVSGERFAVAQRSGDWIGIWFGGREAWLSDRDGEQTSAGGGVLVTPRPGLASIPVYGRAYPASVSTEPLGYTIPAGQMYVAVDEVGADYYDAHVFDAPTAYTVVAGDERFYAISFNHRLAFVRAADVARLPAAPSD
jgi:N-acetyl-anhydromuramyl-L-alanine amidase AmpD